MGSALLSKESPFELARILNWDKEEESLENCSLIPILDHMLEEKQEDM